METKTIEEAREELKYYKAIHSSNLYKNIIKKGGRELWKSYLKERFGVESCKELDIITLKSFTDSIYKMLEGSNPDNKVVSIMPYIKRQEERENGTEKATNKQLWAISVSGNTYSAII